MIKWTKSNDCVGCETCHNCGLDKSHKELDDLICDTCHSSEDRLYSPRPGVQLCIKCLVREGFVDEINDDNFEEFI